VMLHRSAKLDYKYYVVNRLLGLVFMTGLTGVGAITGAVIVANLEALFGPANLTWSGSALATLGIVYFVVTTLATDLGFFLCHALHHKSKFFWEFHKVHHSAQVLTPITNYRFHPVEKILMVTITGITAGSVIGVFFYLFGDQVGVPNYLLITAANVGVITYGFRFIANHRHSHIWLSFGPKLEHVFISPAQHQIHHSCEARHLDKNLGLQFAIWDWIAGTLYVPNGWELFALGLENDEHEDYDSIRSLYLLPFKRAWAVLGAGQSRAPTASARETGGQ